MLFQGSSFNSTRHVLVSNRNALAAAANNKWMPRYTYETGTMWNTIVMSLKLFLIYFKIFKAAWKKKNKLSHFYTSLDIYFPLCMCLVLCHSIPHILSNDKRIKFKINKPFVQKVSCVMPLFCFNVYMNVCWCVCVYSKALTLPLHVVSVILRQRGVNLNRRCEVSSL